MYNIGCTIAGFAVIIVSIFILGSFTMFLARVIDSIGLTIPETVISGLLFLAMTPVAYLIGKEIIEYGN